MDFSKMKFDKYGYGIDPEKPKVQIDLTLDDFFDTDEELPEDTLKNLSVAKSQESINQNLANSGAREAQAKHEAYHRIDNLNLRANLIKHNYKNDRKEALYMLKKMQVGETLVVAKPDFNHLRVACTYQKNTYEKEFYTRTFEYNKHKYLEIRRAK
jgi:hypothetical protein